MRNKILAMLLALGLILLSLAGCGAEKAPAPGGDEGAAEAAGTAGEGAGAAEAAETDRDYAALCAPVLDACFHALNGDLEEPDETLPMGITEIAMWQSGPEALASVGYRVEDWSGDGVPELILASTGEDRTIYALYALTGDAPSLLFESWSRNAYRWLGEGRFFYYGSGGAAYSAFGTYALSESAEALNCEDFYFTDVAADDPEKILYYHNQSGVWDPAEAELLEIGDDAFWALIETMDTGAEELYPLAFSAYWPTDGPAIRPIWANEVGLVEGVDVLRYQVPGSDPEGQVLFEARRNVSDFRLLALSLKDVTEAGEPIFEEKELFAQDAMKAGDLLLADLSFMGDLPEYGISFKEEDGSAHRYALWVSGFDGSLELEALN